MSKLTLSQISKLVEVFSVAEANDYLKSGWKIFDKRLVLDAPNGATTSYVLAWYEENESAEAATQPKDNPF